MGNIEEERIFLSMFAKKRNSRICLSVDISDCCSIHISSVRDKASKRKVVDNPLLNNNQLFNGRGVMLGCSGGSTDDEAAAISGDL